MTNQRTRSVAQIVEAALDPGTFANDATVQALTEQIRSRHQNKVVAILLYGSYLRGQRDGLLDFYVLMSDFVHALPRGWHRIANELLPPNVYHLSAGQTAEAARCKYATLRLKQFERLNAEAFHSYFWARFAQPVRLVWVLDEASRHSVVQAIAAASVTFIERVAPLQQGAFSPQDLWTRGFAATYRAELRAEDQSRSVDLYQANQQYFCDLLAAYARGPEAACIVSHDHYRNVGVHRFVTAIWWLRRAQGKLLSFLRLVKAAGTFDDPLDYILWKIERHSGFYIRPSERQRRHPLVFAWPLLWKLYRKGAFR